MKLSKTEKDNIRKIFDSRPNLKSVWKNTKGEYFTSYNYAKNSEKNSADLIEIKRSDIVDKAVDLSADGKNLRFPDLSEGEIPKVGDKAKDGRKNADGVYVINPNLSYTFEKGQLKDISESKK